MNPVSRGVRNAFRNGVRTSSIVLILGLSIGLSLTMLVAQKAVEKKIESIKSSIGNTITVSPAGFNPGSTTNNALTTTLLNEISLLSHVSSITETLTDRLSTTGSSSTAFGRFGNSNSSGSTTSLNSPTTINVDSNRSGSGDGFHVFVQGGGSLPSTFSLPITFLGTNNQPTAISGVSIAVTKGSAIIANADTNDVLISQAMATKNKLGVGATFAAYNTTLTVKGIFTSNTKVADDTVVLSLPALQRLTGQNDVVTNAIVTVDSLDNLASVTSSIKSTLGSNADVTSAQEQADSAVQPLDSVKTVSAFSLIGAVVAGAVIIVLTMVMVVRERKKEIGVVKAIGGSNLRIVSEFMIESLTLAILGAVVGLIIGVIGGQPVTKMLVNNSTSSSTTQITQRPGGLGGPGTASSSTTRPTRGDFGEGFRRNGAIKGLSNIKAEIGPSILLEGFGAAILIAVIGSALAAGMISRIRPSTIMRAE